MSDDVFEILEKLDVETYLDQEGIEYKKTYGSSGEQLNVRCCPACGDDRWKVFLNADSGLGNCFAGDCSIKYNKYKFVSAHTGLKGRALNEHIRSMGLMLGWRPPRTISTAVQIEKAGLVLPKSVEIPIDGLHNLKYLKNRNISKEIAKYFHLRYCEKGWFKYIYDGKECFMNFDSRIIIPIFDVDGMLVSFQGRDITGEHPKKYLFPPGYAVTGSHLFNSHNVIATKRVLVGEGVFDVMAQKIALDEDESLRDVVPIGTFGKHLSENQLLVFVELMKRGVTEVTLMWDSEVAALDAAVEAGKRLRGFGFSVRIALLPEGKDPNEVPPNVVRERYYSALSLTDTNAAKLKLKVRS